MNRCPVCQTPTEDAVPATGSFSAYDCCSCGKYEITDLLESSWQTVPPAPEQRAQLSRLLKTLSRPDEPLPRVTTASLPHLLSQALIPPSIRGTAGTVTDGIK